MKKPLVDGFEELFKNLDVVSTSKPRRTELKLPCVIWVRDYEIFQVVKQIAVALDIRWKLWKKTIEDTMNVDYYCVLFDGPITGVEIAKLVGDFENRS